MRRIILFALAAILFNSGGLVWNFRQGRLASARAAWGDIQIGDIDFSRPKPESLTVVASQGGFVLKVVVPDPADYFNRVVGEKTSNKIPAVLFIDGARYPKFYKEVSFYYRQEANFFYYYLTNKEVLNKYPLNRWHTFQVFLKAQPSNPMLSGDTGSDVKIGFSLPVSTIYQPKLALQDNDYLINFQPLKIDDYRIFGLEFQNQRPDMQIPLSSCRTRYLADHRSAEVLAACYEVDKQILRTQQEVADLAFEVSVLRKLFNIHLTVGNADRNWAAAVWNFIDKLTTNLTERDQIARAKELKTELLSKIDRVKSNLAVLETDIRALAQSLNIRLGETDLSEVGRANISDKCLKTYLEYYASIKGEVDLLGSDIQSSGSDFENECNFDFGNRTVNRLLCSFTDFFVKLQASFYDWSLRLFLTTLLGNVDYPNAKTSP